MSRFHRCDFEVGFTDEDPWWKPGSSNLSRLYSDSLVANRYIDDGVDDRETPEHAQTRLRGFLGYSFESMPETCKLV